VKILVGFVVVMENVTTVVERDTLKSILIYVMYVKGQVYVLIVKEQEK
jgi:hypothetical protein